MGSIIAHRAGDKERFANLGSSRVFDFTAFVSCQGVKLSNFDALLREIKFPLREILPKLCTILKINVKSGLLLYKAQQKGMVRFTGELQVTRVRYQVLILMIHVA